MADVRDKMMDGKKNYYFISPKKMCLPPCKDPSLYPAQPQKYNTKQIKKKKYNKKVNMHVCYFGKTYLV